MQLIHADIHAGKRIQAVKKLKNAAKCSLKEAKYGVDNIGADILHDADRPLGSPLFLSNAFSEVKVIPLIAKVELAMGEGKAMVDIETASFQILTQLGVIPLKELRRVLKLLELLKDFNESEICNADDEKA